MDLGAGKLLTIKLEDYVEVLQKSANGKLENLHKLHGKEWRLAKELLDEGLISDAREELGFSKIVKNMVITPSGAIALAHWVNFLRESSFQHKILKAIERIFWLVVGALLASTPELLKWFSS